MKRCFPLSVVVSLLMGGCLLTGCSILLEGEGEVGFRQSTEWALYHEAQPTIERASKSAIESQSLEEWLFGEPTEPVCVSTVGVATLEPVQPGGPP